MSCTNMSSSRMCFVRSTPRLDAPRLRGLTVDVVHQSDTRAEFTHEVFCHHPIGNSSHQCGQFCFGRTQARCCVDATISMKHFARGTPFKYLAIRFMFTSSLSVGCKSCLCRLLHAVQNSGSFLARTATCPLQSCTQPVSLLPARSRIAKSVSGSRLAFSKVSHPPVPATQSFFTANFIPVKMITVVNVI